MNFFKVVRSPNTESEREKLIDNLQKLLAATNSDKELPEIVDIYLDDLNAILNAVLKDIENGGSTNEFRVDTRFVGCGF